MSREGLALKIVGMLLEAEKPGELSVSTLKTGYEKYEGKNIFIRTVTHHYTGRVVETTPLTLTLEDAAWIADDGLFHEALKDSDKFDEVEPYANPITVNIYSILDVTEIEKLPKGVK